MNVLVMFSFRMASGVKPSRSSGLWVIVQSGVSGISRSIEALDFQTKGAPNALCFGGDLHVQ